MCWEFIESMNLSIRFYNQRAQHLEVFQDIDFNTLKSTSSAGGRHERTQFRLILYNIYFFPLNETCRCVGGDDNFVWRL